MRLPLRVATEIRARQLIAPCERVLIALSGGPDSVALLHCLLELSRKRDLAFTLTAAHLHHGLRGKAADADQRFCEKLCASLNIPLLCARVDTPKLVKHLKRSREEAARIARHEFLAQAAAQTQSTCVAVAHHADDRIETLLYRLCRGTGLAGLQGISWTGPLRLEGQPDVAEWIKWATPHSGLGGGAAAEWLARPSPARGEGNPRVVRPLLACTRAEILEYLKSKRQPFCTDKSNLDTSIPRNAIRNLILPALEERAHPGVRSALWRLAEEAECAAETRIWRRQWLIALASAANHDELTLPITALPPTSEELTEILETLQALWRLPGGGFTRKHSDALRALFEPHSGPKQLDLPGAIGAERRGKSVSLRRLSSVEDLTK
ncbi:MAG TPA: tRNA lysidine(34) synthetase TilS [Planctomycetota bacterium]|jgi:tRNA(Ile)-lysidine synthetase-like protein